MDTENPQPTTPELQDLRNIIDVTENVVARLRAIVPQPEGEWLEWRLNGSQRTLDDLRRELTKLTNEAQIVFLKRAPTKPPDVELRWDCSKRLIAVNPNGHPHGACMRLKRAPLRHTPSSYLDTKSAFMLEKALNDAWKTGQSIVSLRLHSWDGALREYRFRTSVVGSELVSRIAYRTVEAVLPKPDPVAESLRTIKRGMLAAALWLEPVASAVTSAIG